MPAIADGQLLVRNHFLSLDPYMRMRMEDVKSYAAPQALDEVMIGGTAGEVIESKHPKFKVGDKVVGMLGWSEIGVSDGTLLKQVDTSRIPLSAYLGVVGMPGMTAWYGLNQIIQPKAGQTIAVTAASGAVGGVVGQLAKLKGCRVIGIAGGKEKCGYVLDELGFDACIDYKGGNLFKDVKAAAPDGIDGLFENVGGAVMDAVLARMNPYGRIALCGLISGYDGQPMPVRSFAGGSHHLLEYLCTAAQPPHVGLREEARRFLVEVLRLVEPSLREPQPRLGIAGVEGGVISTWIRPRNTGQHQCQHDCTA